ncbi:hypothetical protein CRG98_041373 [Punica granatum]|uniref:Uncharacterized protein n=1 Tax=Punica granatum TaxID=22663 RepID=A0A2I0I2M0_PUNGR|nr:hypothetical protein CRG98_041373 [Punica granatum]
MRGQTRRLYLPCPQSKLEVAARPKNVPATLSPGEDERKLGKAGRPLIEPRRSRWMEDFDSKAQSSDWKEGEIRGFNGRLWSRSTLWRPKEAAAEHFSLAYGKRGSLQWDHERWPAVASPISGASNSDQTDRASPVRGYRSWLQLNPEPSRCSSILSLFSINVALPSPNLADESCGQRRACVVVVQLAVIGGHDGSQVLWEVAALGFAGLV